MYIFQTTDPLKRRVVLSDNTWGHIVDENGRTEFEGKPDVIRQTIEQPHIIVPSSKNPNSDVYYRLGAHPEYPELFVKVPVLFRTPQEGTVSTALLQHDAAQGSSATGGYRYVSFRR